MFPGDVKMVFRQYSATVPGDRSQTRRIGKVGVLDTRAGAVALISYEGSKGHDWVVSGHGWILLSIDGLTILI